MPLRAKAAPEITRPPARRSAVMWTWASTKPDTVPSRLVPLKGWPVAPTSASAASAAGARRKKARTARTTRIRPGTLARSGLEDHAAEGLTALDVLVSRGGLGQGER